MIDRKSTRLNSSHITTSYAVFCLKKKKVFFQIKRLAFGTLHLIFNLLSQSSFCSSTTSRIVRTNCITSILLLASAFLVILLLFFFLMTRRAPRSTLFPYTTLFRSIIHSRFLRPDRRRNYWICCLSFPFLSRLE